MRKRKPEVVRFLLATAVLSAVVLFFFGAPAVQARSHLQCVRCDGPTPCIGHDHSGAASNCPLLAAASCRCKGLSISACGSSPGEAGPSVKTMAAIVPVGPVSFLPASSGPGSRLRDDGGLESLVFPPPKRPPRE